MFNIPVVKKIKKVISRWRVMPKIWIMDAGDLGTSCVLQKFGISASNITAFTLCRYDYRNMKKKGSEAGFKFRNISATDLYSGEEFRGDYHIVVDDGMSTAKTTFERVRKLLDNGPDFLALFCNISTRSNNGKEISNANFMEQIHILTKESGYIILEDKCMTPYKQTKSRGITMAPYYFFFVKV